MDAILGWRFDGREQSVQEKLREPSPLEVWLNDLVRLREGETDEQRLERIRDALGTIDLDEDI